MVTDTLTKALDGDYKIAAKNHRTNEVEIYNVSSEDVIRSYDGVKHGKDKNIFFAAARKEGSSGEMTNLALKIMLGKSHKNFDGYVVFYVKPDGIKLPSGDSYEMYDSYGFYKDYASAKAAFYQVCMKEM